MALTGVFSHCFSPKQVREVHEGMLEEGADEGTADGRDCPASAFVHMCHCMYCIYFLFFL